MPDDTTTERPGSVTAASMPAPTPVQRAWLVRGLGQPGGKLPLFDEQGRRTNAATVRACIALGWAEPWFANPLKPDWLVCRLTTEGRARLAAAENVDEGEDDRAITAPPDCAGG